MKISSPATAANPRNKKTRDLPNLSDCNCCNHRINITNPKNRLGILTSNWRIVLLCKNCHNFVESSQICSYCLTRVSLEFYDCKKCRRRIHKDCVSKFSIGLRGNCDEFSVCFDCWIPNLLENEYNCSRAVRIGTSKKELGKNGVELSSLASSGLCNLQEKGKSLENVVSEAERKIIIAVEAKERAFTDVMVGKKGVEVASEAVGFVASGDQEEGSVVDEDAQLAIRLHREMNSSPRISRNPCSLNTHCVETRGGNETSCSGRVMNVETGVNGVEMGLLLGRERKGSSVVRQECGNGFGRVRDGMCDGDAKGCLITYVRKGKEKGKVPKFVKCKEGGPPLKVYSRKLSRMKLEPCLFPLHVVKREHVQFSKTYSRRRLECKSKLVNNSLNLENGNLS